MSIYGTIVDKREPKKVREYGEDEEGRLLREFDMAVSDSAVTPAEIEEIREALRKERERVRQARRDELIAEIENARSKQEELNKELSELQEAITLGEQEILEKIRLQEQEEQTRITSEMQEEQEKNAKEAEETKSQLAIELQEAKEQIEAKIRNKKDKVEEAKAKYEEVHEEATVHVQALTLYKDPTSRVYTAAKEELEKCNKKAKSVYTRVKRLAREIARLEQDLSEVDKLLERLDDGKEISKQEDEMWEAYRAETEVTEKTRDREVEAGLEEKQLEEENEEARVAEETKEEIAEYDKNLGSKLDNVGIGNDGLKPEGSQRPVPPLPPKKPIKPIKPQPPKQPTKTNLKVKTVGLMIEENGAPRYYAIMIGANGEEMTVKSQQRGEFADIPSITGELRAELTQKGIYQPDKYYDAGLDKFLVELDEKFGRMEKGPSGEMRPIDREAYITMIAQKDMMVGKNPIPFEIDYDLSDLYQMPETIEGKNRLKDIKRVARANHNKGLAIYQKAPGIFKRLMRLVKMKSLPEAKSEELDSLEEMLCSQYRSKYRDKDFDPYAISDITKEEADIIAKDAERILKEEDDAIGKFKHRTKLERAERERVSKMSFKERLQDMPTYILNKINREEPNGTSIGPRSKRYEGKGIEPGDD